jgi:hypothetical protein
MQKWCLLKLFQESGEGMIKDSCGGGGEFSMIYLIYWRNFCKCYNLPLPSTTKKGKKVSSNIKKAWRYSVNQNPIALQKQLESHKYCIWRFKKQVKYTYIWRREAFCVVALFCLCYSFIQYCDYTCIVWSIIFPLLDLIFLPLISNKMY